jgi:SAM-dependent methyltransferase
MASSILRTVPDAIAAPPRRLEPATRSGRRILNLGSGLKRVPGAINVDITRATDPDVVHDLNERPWPFEDGAFDDFRLYDVLEHLDDVVATMEEIHRVAAPGAIVHITVPHFSCANAFTDITHRHYFGYFSCHYFTGENEFPFYTAARFKRRVANIIFYPTIVNKVVWRLANRWPRSYERSWAWIFPAWYLSFELQVVKDPAGASLPGLRAGG